MDRIRVAGGMFAMAWERRSWWLFPVLVALLVVGLFIGVSASSSLAPFLYPLF
jgi:hypothetical protein